MAIDPNLNQTRDPNRPPVRRDRGAGGWAWVVIVIIVVIVIWLVVGGRGSHNRAMANPASQNAAGTQNTSSENNEAGQNAAGQIIDPAQLSGKEAENLVGHPIQIASAKVLDGASGGAFLIDTNGSPVLVVQSPEGNPAAAGTSEGSAKTETSGGVWKKDHATTREQVRDNGAGQIANKGKGAPDSGSQTAPPLAQESTRPFNKGDVVSIQGTVQKMPSERAAMTQFNLSSDEAARLSKAKVYIAASSVQPAAK